MTVPPAGAACSSRTAAPEHDAPTQHSVKKVIGVVSGKGGVGKSMTSALLACAMTRRGYHCGILDADITGPSIPKLFGIHGRAMADDKGCWPIQSRMGIDVMSINLLVENEDTNKAFGIGFGTFPSDDTGVFHILEHSVLAGSEKYPVTSPFLQLLKSSMASFLTP